MSNDNTKGETSELARYTAHLIGQNRIIGELKAEIIDLQRPALQARISNQRKQIEELLTKMARMAGKKCVYIASLRNENAKLQSDLAASKDYAENLCRLQESADSRMRQACFDEVLASFHRPGKGVNRKPSGIKQ